MSELDSVASEVLLELRLLETVVVEAVVLAFSVDQASAAAVVVVAAVLVVVVVQVVDQEGQAPVTGVGSGFLLALELSC